MVPIILDIFSIGNTKLLSNLTFQQHLTVCYCFCSSCLLWARKLGPLPLCKKVALLTPRVDISRLEFLQKSYQYSLYAQSLNFTTHSTCPWTADVAIDSDFALLCWNTCKRAHYRRNDYPHLIFLCKFAATFAHPCTYTFNRLTMRIVSMAVHLTVYFFNNIKTFHTCFRKFL